MFSHKKKVIWALLRVIISVYLLTVMAMFLWQEKLIFFPEKLAADFKFPFNGAAERWVDVEGVKINTLLFKAPKSKGVILYFHGNAGSLAGWGEVAQELVQRTGWDVWILDYPGYGKSEGTISSEEQLHRMSSVFLTEARKEYPASPMILYGRSIGSGMAVKLAAENKVDGLILESPFLSVAAVARSHYPFVPASLLKYHFRSDEEIKKVNASILIVHGTEDEIIPFEHGESLSKIRAGTAFSAIENAQHNDLAAFPEYWKALKAWLDR